MAAVSVVKNANAEYWLWMRGPLRDCERRNSEPSGTAASPHPLAARGERESRAEWLS
jgi:hypothetical protein